MKQPILFFFLGFLEGARFGPWTNQHNYIVTLVATKDSSNQVISRPQLDWGPWVQI
jgi:hypothetical protein